MTIDEIKKEISRRTGVPASLLFGETVEENIAQAKAMMGYWDYEKRKPTTVEQFVRWLNAQLGEDEPQDEAEAVLAELYTLADTRTTRERFADWMTNQNN